MHGMLMILHIHERVIQNQTREKIQIRTGMHMLKSSMFTMASPE